MTSKQKQYWERYGEYKRKHIEALNGSIKNNNNMMPTLLPLQMITNIGKDYKTTKIDNNMPGQQPHVSTVTIPLDEYNEMNKSLDMLNNALEDNKVIIRDTSYRSFPYMAYQTFTRDEALNKIAVKYYKLEGKYKALQDYNESLASEIHELMNTRWYKLMKWFK